MIKKNIIITIVLGIILFVLFMIASKCKVNMNKEELIHHVNVAQVIAEELKIPEAIDLLNKAEATLKSEVPEKAALEAISELIDKLILEIEKEADLVNAEEKADLINIEEKMDLVNALKVLKASIRIYSLQ